MPGGQLRVWRVGEGPPCVVLPGLINGASVVAGRLASALVDAVVIELPGLGGSAGIVPADFAGVAAAVGAAVRALGLGGAPVLARDVVALADALDLPRFDLWGTHTGALIALEVGLIAPGRVGCAILEGPVLLPPSLNSDILTNYFPPLEPHPWGLHVQQAWNMRRDMFLFWPWYRAELAAARPLGIPDPAFLHDWTIGLLQSGASYHRSYRAAFAYDTPARLKLLACPSLVCAGRADMLVGCLATARAMDLPRVTVRETQATVWYPKQPADAFAATIELYRSFLDQHGSTIGRP